MLYNKRSGFKVGCICFVLLSLFAFSLNQAKAEEVVTETQKKLTTSRMNMPDNDVYLITPGLYKTLSRLRAGELFNPLPALLKEQKKNPHLPSTHIWVAARYMGYLAVDPQNKSWDKAIIKNLENCLVRSERAISIKKLRHAGMFHKAMCNIGLASFNGRRKNFIKAGLYARKGVNQFFELLKERPNHHATLMAVGAYNYFTSRMGSLGKVMLTLLMIPVGNRELGLKQLYQATENGSPVDIMGRRMLVPAMQWLENDQQEATKLASKIVELVPKNSESRLMLANQYLFSGQLDLVEQELTMAKKFNVIDCDKKQAPIEYIVNNYRIEMLGNILDTLNNQNDKALKSLYEYCKKIKGRPQFVNISALFFTAHLFKLANLTDKANKLYLKIAKNDDLSNWTREQANEFITKKDIGDRIRLAPAQKQKLHDWLKDMPLPKIED